MRVIWIIENMGEMHPIFRIYYIEIKEKMEK